MNERIEWIEPREVTREKSALLLQAERDRRAEAACRPMLPGVLAVFATLWFAPEIAFQVGLGVAGILALFGAPLASMPQSASEGSIATCVLDGHGAAMNLNGQAIARFPWESARSFDIADHPRVPGLRLLTIRGEGSTSGTQLCFHAGQIDEAALRTFVHERIADQVTQRLMRRVKM